MFVLLAVATLDLAAVASADLGADFAAAAPVVVNLEAQYAQKNSAAAEKKSMMMMDVPVVVAADYTLP